MAPTATPSKTALLELARPEGVAPAATGGFFKGLLTPANLGMVLAGVQAGGILRRGREAEDIAAQRAAIDRANAAAVRTASVERAKILSERGERLKARQKSQFISGNIRTNVGVPLLVETQTRRDIAKDIGFDLDVGRAESSQFLSSALLEERIGKAQKKRSKLEAIGVIAGKSLSFLGT